MKSIFKGMRVISVCICAVLSLSAHAAKFEGFVQITSDRELFVKWDQAQAGFPTVILLNGLTYSTRQWTAFTETLHAKGFGVIRYDMMGMGETLLKYAPVVDKISYQTQIEDLRNLIQALKLKGKVNLVGLSYGGGIAMAFAAQYPQLIKNLILMAPFTEPLEQQDLWIRNQVAITRLLNPFNPYSDEEIYDYFLRQNVYSTYPSAEPIVLENPYKLEATFRLVQGIRHWNSGLAVEKLPKRSVHLMIAGFDQYIERSILENFWQSIPTQSRSSKLVILQSEHKIPEAVPHFSAYWIAEILDQNKRLNKGNSFEGNPWTGVIQMQVDEFIIGKEY